MWTLCRYLHILYSGKERKKYLTIVQLDETPVRIEEESQIRLPRANEADVNNGANNASTGANSFFIKNHRRSRLGCTLLSMFYWSLQSNGAVEEQKN